ncbi:ATP-binding protein [Nonomuraea typhae]|uniref:ATP-binding protein n=1 Tax=Nonomuraea typhae TaxID=2603600 RepID=UPI0012F72E9F|nr:ATP-binding protein [Nonomuraea typhae]
MTPALTADAVARRANLAGIPALYRGLRLTDWNPYNNHAHAARSSVEAFLDTFEARVSSEAQNASRSLLGRGLALVGPAGAGKTTLACITATETAERHNAGIMFVAVADYMKALAKQHAIKAQADRGVQEAIDLWWAIERMVHKAETTPLLVFDDVGKEHRTASNAAIDEVDRLLRMRFRRALPTVATTNLRLAAWGESYNPSMASFAHETFDEVVLGGVDLRKEAARARR